MAHKNLEQKDQTAEQEPKKGKILLVDDSSMMIGATADSLKAEGFEVDTAALSQTAFKLLAENSNTYAGMIVDGLNGHWVEATGMALNLGLKVTLYTSNPSKYKDHEWIVSGRVKILSKPASVEELMASLEIDLAQKPNNPQ